MSSISQSRVVPRLPSPPSRWNLEEPATQAAATQSPATQSHGRIERRRPQHSGRRAAEQAWLGLALGFWFGFGFGLGLG